MTAEGTEYWTREHPEPVVLDIGGDAGALLLFTAPELHGREIEVSPIEHDDVRTHTAVLQRLVNGRPVFVAVYPALPAGEYRIWDDVPGRAHRVAVAGGEVVEVDWVEK